MYRILEDFVVTNNININVQIKVDITIMNKCILYCSCQCFWFPILPLNLDIFIKNVHSKTENLDDTVMILIIKKILLYYIRLY